MLCAAWDNGGFTGRVDKPYAPLTPEVLSARLRRLDSVCGDFRHGIHFGGGSDSELDAGGDGEEDESESESEGGSEIEGEDAAETQAAAAQRAAARRWAFHAAFPAVAALLCAPCAGQQAPHWLRLHCGVLRLYRGVWRQDARGSALKAAIRTAARRYGCAHDALEALEAHLAARAAKSKKGGAKVAGAQQAAGAAAGR
jgi:hypothetical protein